MKKRAKICFYIFLVCAFCALGILGYFVFNNNSDNVMVGSRKFVTFNQVPGAISYSLSVSSTENALTDYMANYKVEKTATSESEYLFTVFVEDSSNMMFARENYTQIITAKNSNDNTIDCEIKDYTIYFFDEFGHVDEVRYYKDQKLKAVNEDIFCCTVSEYFDSLFTEDGSYQIDCIAFDEENNEIESSQTRINYDYQAYYEKDFERRGNYFINGEWYDYIISSKAELEKLVWHSILYRKNDVTFFVKTNDITSANINNLVYKAIVSYPEYDALNDEYTYAKMEENIGKLINFTYYLDEDFTETFLDLEDKDSYTYNMAVKYLHKKDSKYNVDYVTKNATDRNFEIDTAEESKVRDEVVVYNTEQLFMAVQYGAKPVFVDESSVAAIVYNNARQELKTINNSDFLTDYEKALNIYRYLCENVVYDYVTYYYMALEDDFSIANFGNNSCFYLEGVFYDLNRQYAVCDGLAKAYTLLCNIEGIECVKVNGAIVENGSEMNHAWNKLYLVDENYDVDGWYYLDTTWGVGEYSERVITGTTDYYEILTHTYFLRADDENRKVNFEGGISEHVKEFDYYRSAKYLYNDQEFDYFILSDDELENLFAYASYKLGDDLTSLVMEVEFDKEYIVNEDSKIFEFIELNNRVKELKAKQNLNRNRLDIERQLREAEKDLKNWFKTFDLDSNIDCDWFVVNDLVVIFRFYI